MDAGTATRFAPAEGFDAGTPRSFNACCISILSVSPACTQEQRSERNAAALSLSTEQWQTTSLMMMPAAHGKQPRPFLIMRALAANTAWNITSQIQGVVPAVGAAATPGRD